MPNQSAKTGPLTARYVHAKKSKSEERHIQEQYVYYWIIITDELMCSPLLLQLVTVSLILPTTFWGKYNNTSY